MASLVVGSRLADVDGREWAFCADPDCDVVYFADDGAMLSKADLSVRVGLKERHAPHTVCYCFGHTEESIHDEIRETGASTVVDAVTARVRAGECSCATMNPTGACCLADLRRVVREATP